jgi:hypothetical protein
MPATGNPRVPRSFTEAGIRSPRYSRIGSDQSRLAIGFYLGMNSLNRHAAPVGRGVVPGLPANGKGLRAYIAAEFGPFVVAGPGRRRRVEQTNSRDPAGGSISSLPSRFTVRSRSSCGREAIKIIVLWATLGADLSLDSIWPWASYAGLRPQGEGRPYRLGSR